MKNLILGMVIGMVSSALLVFLIAPQWSDHRAAAETSAWLAQVRPVQEAIAENAKQRGSLESAGVGVAKPVFQGAGPSDVDVASHGEIFLKGGSDGQLLVLRPYFTEGKEVKWRCIGGSARATLSCH